MVQFPDCYVGDGLNIERDSIFNRLNKNFKNFRILTSLSIEKFTDKYFKNIFNYENIKNYEDGYYIDNKVSMCYLYTLIHYATKFKPLEKTINYLCFQSFFILICFYRNYNKYEYEINNYIYELTILSGNPYAKLVDFKNITTKFLAKIGKKDYNFYVGDYDWDYYVSLANLT